MSGADCLSGVMPYPMHGTLFSQGLCTACLSTGPNGEYAVFRVFGVESDGSQDVLDLNSEIVTGFRQDMRCLLRCHHPAVARVMDFGVTSDGRFFVVHRHAGGTSLRDMIDAGSGISRIWQVVMLAQSVAAALETAFMCGVSDRQVIPDDVIVSPDAAGNIRVTLSGIGTARLHEEVARKYAVSQGFIPIPVVTAPYVPPERFAESGHRQDVYILAVLVFEMLTGTVPFSGDTYLEIMMNVYAGRPERLSLLDTVYPPGLSHLLYVSLTDPEGCPARPSAFVYHLQSVIDPL